MRDSRLSIQFLFGGLLCNLGVFCFVAFVDNEAINPPIPIPSISDL